MRGKVKIINDNHQYRRMFKDRGWSIAETVEEADLVQFTGGEDVTPELYGEANTHSYNSVARDLHEISIWRKCLAMDKPMAGICRGGQFLNVMSGGKMVQDIKGHATGRQHPAINHRQQRSIQVTSTHHQMMVPGRNAVVLMTAGIVGNRDMEALYYYHTNSLCFQPHPEFDEATEDCVDTYFGYIDGLILRSM